MRSKRTFIFTSAIALILLTVLFSAHPALASDGGGKAPSQQSSDGSGVHTRTSVVPYANNTACNGNSSNANCDGYDPIGSHCSASWGAYRLAGDPAYLQMMWSPNCNSNYFYTYVPSGLSCGSYTCNAIEYVLFQRSIYSASYCNAHSTTCGEEPASVCPSPGNCPVSTMAMLPYSASSTYGGGATFNGVYMGTWVTSWQTDMLYAPSQSVLACTMFTATQDPSQINFLCTQWH
jgi:hypothetical protein